MRENAACDAPLGVAPTRYNTDSCPSHRVSKLDKYSVSSSRIMRQMGNAS
ncbi:hypothetical protein [Longispora fulva]|uniref:Uncharacterized protein n=1 Tax=Longispora fulva TaxID=619741 RepID=A0A8J7GEV3_9ACTN|nr:hypothetical protein [Longispora fulva]MBG6136600.1 hypothetical protein [Longispora fulva]